jgi:copper transport protein
VSALDRRGRGRSRGRGATALVALAALACLVVPALAGAHATLEASTPQRGAVVARSPSTVTFRYDEPVEGNFGAIRVFDAHGDRVDQGDAFHPGGVGSRLAIHLKPRLPDGTYTATYRVISADSHIVSSGIVFSVGHAGATGESVEQLLSASQTGRVTSTVFTLTRALQYAALALVGGALAFLVLCWSGARGPDEASTRAAGAALVGRLRPLVLGASVVGLISACAAIVLEGAEAAGVSGWSALNEGTVREVLGTRFGTSWALAAGCWLAVLLLVAILGRRWPARVGPALLPIGYLVLLPALSGHGSTQSPVGVLFPANVLHVVAMTAWLGGLVALLVAVPAATRRLESADRTPLLAGVLTRFSTVALVAVAVLLVSGLIQAFFEIRHLDLIFTTAFGRAVFIKLVLLLGLIALGAVNRRRTVPRLEAAARARQTPGSAGVVLRRTLRGEVALIAAVLVVTGALAGYAPATMASSGPFSATTRIGPQELQLTVDPARVGANEVHLYLIDPKTGAQLDSAKEVDVAASMAANGIGKISQEGTKAGPGHYVVPALALGMTGTWQLTVTVRVSEFDEYTKVLEVAVR